MKSYSTTLRELVSFRDIRNAVLGILVLFGGLALAAWTYFVRDTPRTAGIAAGVSLVFVLLVLIFVVPPLLRNASREASQLNLPFEFTTGGAIMLGLIAIVGFSAWNTANNLLFLVLSFMAAAMVVGFVAGALCLKKLEIKMRFPETIFAGEKTNIFVNLTNSKKLLPSLSVVADVRGTMREESAAAADLRRLLPTGIANRLSKPPIIRRTLDYFIYIPRNGESEGKTAHLFPHRGRFLIKDFELSTKFPFGFFRHRRRLPAKETELIVFPALIPVDTKSEEIPLEAGKVVASKRGSGQDLLALRDYQPNDDLRRIDWKATARTRHLIVREFSAEDDRKVTVFLDTFVPSGEGKRMTVREKLDSEQRGENPGTSERFERGVSIAASLIAEFTEEQAEIRLMVGTGQGEYGVGSRHLHDCLKRLAVVEPEVDNPDQRAIEEFADLLDDSEGSHIFIVTAREKALFTPEILQKCQIIEF